MHMWCCDIMYDVTALFNNVMLANKMTCCVRSMPTQNCPKQQQKDKSNAATVHPERRVFRAMPHIYQRHTCVFVQIMKFLCSTIRLGEVCTDNNDDDGQSLLCRLFIICVKSAKTLNFLFAISTCTPTHQF